MPNEDPRPPTRQKALAINLAKELYGTFSEIGAGQEVARWFFKVGGASGTIAKTMSAYDMTISDVIYGKAQRYVSQPRLETMVRREFDLLVKRLTPERGRNTRFFSFADTVKARLRDAADLGIRELTVYSFSTENWSRPESEVRTLMEMFSRILWRKVMDL